MRLPRQQPGRNTTSFATEGKILENTASRCWKGEKKLPDYSRDTRYPCVRSGVKTAVVGFTAATRANQLRRDTRFNWSSSSSPWSSSPADSTDQRPLQVGTRVKVGWPSNQRRTRLTIASVLRFSRRVYCRLRAGYVYVPVRRISHLRQSIFTILCVRLYSQYSQFP